MRGGEHKDNTQEGSGMPLRRTFETPILASAREKSLEQGRIVRFLAELTPNVLLKP